MTPEDKEQIIQGLREQVQADNRTEPQCEKLLIQVAWILIPNSPTDTYLVSSQDNFSSGRTDVIVIAEKRLADGGSRKIAYIWELKAPQLPLFTMPPEGSLAYPSAGLVEAENQLIHYHHTISGDRDWRNMNDIESGQVKFGGIIIGREKDFVKHGNHEDPGQCRKRAQRALDIRTEAFYKSCSFEVFTWDMILTKLENNTLSHQKYQGEPGRVINLKASSNIRTLTSDVKLQVENTED